MSVEREIYIGPYMVIAHKTKEITLTKLICGNEKCKKHEKELKSKFCSECGEHHIHKVSTVTKNISAEDVLSDNDFEDSTYAVHYAGTEIHKDRSILIPNTSDGRPKRFNTEEPGEDGISKDTIAADIEWFDTRFSSEVDLLVKEFGKENVEVKWGLVVHYN